MVVSKEPHGKAVIFFSSFLFSKHYISDGALWFAGHGWALHREEVSDTSHRRSFKTSAQ